MKQSLLTLKIFLLVGKLGAMFFQGSKGSHNIIEALQISLRKFLLSFFFFLWGAGNKGVTYIWSDGFWSDWSLLPWLIVALVNHFVFNHALFGTLRFKVKSKGKCSKKEDILVGDTPLSIKYRFSRFCSFLLCKFLHITASVSLQ